jgi:hypothetical protein
VTIETISTTEVCAILGFNVTIAQIKALNVEPVTETKMGARWEKARVWHILRRLGDQLTYKSAQLHHQEMLAQSERRGEELPELPF